VAPVQGRELRLEVRREDIALTRIREQPLPELGDGEALFEVESFAVTANNVTYGELMGERLGYWRLFPAPDGWGQVPVWGYLRTVESRVPGLAAGRRAYGFCPPASHVVLAPDRVTEAGFLDVAAHRAPLGTVYNSYAWLDTDPAYEAAIERHLLVLRPLFWLSFMLVEELTREAALDDCEVLITSASSKASIGTAHLLAERGLRPPIGLTSAEHVAFVQGLGLYAEVCAYPDAASLQPGRAVLLDIAGNSETRAVLERRFGDQLARTVLAGGTHVDPGGIDPDSDSFFFVPERMRARAREIGWSELNARYCRDVKAFAREARAWLDVDVASGAEGVTSAYLAAVENATPPHRTSVLSLQAERAGEQP
jgi:hypothetical protein